MCWISVEDRLPEESQLVLTWNQEDVKVDVYAWIGDYYGIGFMKDLMQEGFKVTHWMPLPDPPKTD